ncbi:MAG: metal-dependent hydrolase [Patescibacteria group bacterium]
MFIGHLPAGYILTKKIQGKLKTNRYLWIGLIASIFPDFDVFYFYFIDKSQHLHHGYWTHLPFDWLVISAVTLLILWLLKKKDYTIAAIIFFSNIFLHFILDTIVGKIEWLYPFTDKAYSLFEVPAVYDFWVWNFIFHWTFLFEIAVIIWAIFDFCSRKNRITPQK